MIPPHPPALLVSMVSTHSPPPSVKAAPLVPSKISKTAPSAPMTFPTTNLPAVNVKPATSSTTMEINARVAQLVLSIPLRGVTIAHMTRPRMPLSATAVPIHII